MTLFVRSRIVEAYILFMLAYVWAYAAVMFLFVSMIPVDIMLNYHSFYIIAETNTQLWYRKLIDILV